MVDFSQIFPYLPYAAPAVVTGMGAWIAAQRTARSNEKIASVKRSDEARQDRINQVHDRAEDLTARFKILMDGYELRIKDLTIEVATLRLEITHLRAELHAPHPLGLRRFENDLQVQHDGTD